MNERAEGLRARTKRFALDVLQLVSRLQADVTLLLTESAELTAILAQSRITALRALGRLSAGAESTSRTLGG